MVYRGYPIAKGGGLERRFARAFSYLDDMIDIDFLTRDCLASDYRKFGITDKKILAVQRSSLPVEVLRFCAAIRELKPDVIHFLGLSFFNFAVSLLVRMICPRSKIIVSLCDSQFLHRKSLRNGFLKRYFLLVSRRIDSLYPSFEKMEKNKKIKAAPCSIVDTTKFFSQEKEAMIYFCGRLEEGKNPLLFLESIKRTRHFLQEKGWRALVVGGGSLEHEVEDFIEKNDLATVVTRRVSGDVSGIAGKSCIFVSLQEHENYPSQSLLEAMASENAVIATNVGDTNLLVENGINGFLVGRNPEEISQKIVEMIGSGSYFDMGKKSREIARYHSVDRYGTYLLQEYENIMSA